MKRTFFKNSIIFSTLIIFVVTFMSIGYAALTKEVSISSNITFYKAGLLRPNSGTPSKFLACDNIPSASVKKIYFRASFPDTAIETCDVSNAQDGSVIAYLKSNGTVYVVADGGVVYSNTATKFSGLVNCNYISFVDTNNYPRFNTTNLTGMNRMFENLCSSSTCSMAKLDLTSFNTSKVTDMGGTFNFAENVHEIDVSNFDTSKVVYMNDMFYGCSSLTSLNLSSWDTSKAIMMGAMFKDTTNLSNIYVSNLWSTANIGDPNNLYSSVCSNMRCDGSEMFANSNLYAAHPYTPCNIRTDAINYGGHNYAQIDGGSSNPGCLDNVSNMPAN